MESTLPKIEEPNMNNHINHQQESVQSIEPLNLKKDEEKQESKKENEINKDTHQEQNNTSPKENLNSLSNNNNNEKGKSHRRGKNETSGERNFKCPDCDKCYLSGPALVIHRKNKHGYNTENEKKSRGRPKKEEQQEATYQNAQVKFNEFLHFDTRKKKEDNNETINLEVMKENMNNIFRQCNNLFNNINGIDNYPFYKLIINNWDKTQYDFPSECFSENVRNENSNNLNKTNSPPLEQIFFLYLKELSTKTNKEYFWFVNKFIVLLREFINSFKKEQVREELKTENEKEYSQLFSADGIPESCNDFFLEFMQPNQYYGLNENELIELAQHFCFWLYYNKYTHSYLTLL